MRSDEESGTEYEGVGIRSFRVVSFCWHEKLNKCIQ